MFDRSYRLFLSWQNFVASPKSFHQTIVGLEANCAISRPVIRGKGRFLSLIEDLSLLNTMTSAKEVGAVTFLRIYKPAKRTPYKCLELKRYIFPEVA